jgi:hypothetical protein
VRSAVESCVVVRGEVTCGVVSGKFLAPRPVRWRATTPQRHRSDSPSARSNWHLGAVLSCLSSGHLPRARNTRRGSAVGGVR